MLKHEKGPACQGCSFYRAEAVPKHWGSPDWPDTYENGRWGPPYALLQGGLSAPHGYPQPSAPREDNPVVRRGHVAWAGGSCGPAFFIALAVARAHAAIQPVPPSNPYPQSQYV